uniref:Uncharacterized protein n=1 Tax=Octopus bimaculoides TaxID=37653 RepID=A0A0L8IH13_OCTBM
MKRYNDNCNNKFLCRKKEVLSLRMMLKTGITKVCIISLRDQQPNVFIDMYGFKIVSSFLVVCHFV